MSKAKVMWTVEGVLDFQDGDQAVVNHVIIHDGKDQGAAIAVLDDVRVRYPSIAWTLWRNDIRRTRFRFTPDSDLESHQSQQ